MKRYNPDELREAADILGEFVSRAENIYGRVSEKNFREELLILIRYATVSSGMYKFLAGEMEAGEMEEDEALNKYASSRVDFFENVLIKRGYTPKEARRVAHGDLKTAVRKTFMDTLDDIEKKSGKKALMEGGIKTQLIFYTGQRAEGVLLFF